MSAEKPVWTEGWYLPYFARKWHYFTRSESLCHRWIFLDNTDGGRPVHYMVFYFDSPTNCKVCQRKYKQGMAAKPVGAEELGT